MKEYINTKGEGLNHSSLMLYICRVPTIYRKRVDEKDEKTLSLRSGNDPVVFEVLLKSTPNTYAIHGWDNSSFMLSYILMYEITDRYQTIYRFFQ